jgi:hypothetical protein
MLINNLRKKLRVKDYIVIIFVLVSVLGIFSGSYLIQFAKEILPSFAETGYRPPIEFDECETNETRCDQGFISRCDQYSHWNQTTEACATSDNSTTTTESSTTTTTTTQAVCTSGTCFSGISNCGEKGLDSGSGSCTNGLCCKPKSGALPISTCQKVRAVPSRQTIRVGELDILRIEIDYITAASYDTVAIWLSQTEAKPSSRQILTFSNNPVAKYFTGVIGVNADSTALPGGGHTFKKSITYWGNKLGTARIYVHVLLDNRGCPDKTTRTISVQ